MKPQELKQEYIMLRAEGRSYSYIAQELHISKSTCTKWEQTLGEDIAQLKKEQLNTLYEEYSMKKEGRIRQLGDTLARIEEALQATDLTDQLVLGPRQGDPQPPPGLDPFLRREQLQHESGGIAGGERGFIAIVHRRPSLS